MGFFGRLFGNKKRDKPAPSSDRRRWSFTTRSSNSSKRRSYPLPSTAAYAAKEEENADKHARAVAAATAAVAEAALAAAHAAAEVVRLTHGSGGRRGVGGGGGSNRRWANAYFAAVKIQSAFRGYLARRALRALKALVKLQALVKGHIVRKQTADMLRRMQTLVRLQARARASRSSSHSSVSFHYSTSLLNPSSSPRSLHSRCVSNAEIFLPIDNPSGSKRLDWLAEEEDDKILEVDTWKPRYRLNESPRKQQQSLLGIRSTENSPQVRSSGSRRRSTPFTPTTTTRSEYSWGCNNTNYYYSGYHPNYMANTESYKAKARSQSAPKQRLEVSNESSGYKRSVKGECYYITEKDVATSPGYYGGVSGELNRNQSAKSRRGSSFLV